MPKRDDLDDRERGEKRSGSGGGTHSLGRADLTLLPATARAPWRIEGLPTPRAVRFPLAEATANVTSIPLLASAPKVSSYRFPRLASLPPIPAAARPSRAATAPSC
jgi:hypothetical protein